MSETNPTRDTPDPQEDKMSTEKMTDRIRKLFAKAESTSSKHEADALMARAYDLLAKYGIEEALARAGDDADESQVGSYDFNARGSYRHDQILLVNVVAKALHCTAVKVGGTHTLRVYGVRRHLDRVEMLAGLLVGYMLATAGQAQSTDPWVATVTYRKSVMMGFMVEVSERLKAADSAAADDTDDAQGVGVVLASDARRAAQALRDAHPKTMNAGVTRRSQDGILAGREAGSQVDLGQQRVRGRRAISA